MSGVDSGGPRIKDVRPLLSRVAKCIVENNGINLSCARRGSHSGGFFEEVDLAVPIFHDDSLCRPQLIGTANVMRYAYSKKGPEEVRKRKQYDKYDGFSLPSQNAMGFDPG
jgi:hypothetical protein